VGIPIGVAAPDEGFIGEWNAERAEVPLQHFQTNLMMRRDRRLKSG